MYMLSEWGPNFKDSSYHFCIFLSHATSSGVTAVLKRVHFDRKSDSSDAKLLLKIIRQKCEFPYIITGLEWTMSLSEINFFQLLTASSCNTHLHVSSNILLLKHSKWALLQNL